MICALTYTVLHMIYAQHLLLLLLWLLSALCCCWRQSRSSQLSRRTAPWLQPTMAGSLEVGG